MMVDAMRWTALLFLPVLLGAVEIGGSNVRTVYITPMTHGLDQHVANRLTRDRVLEVVADPARADAILTDRLGEPLEYQLEKLHPTPKPPEEDAASDSDKDDSDTAHAPPAKRLMTNVEPRASAFGGGKGTVFLVDAHSRAILWSVYERPKRTTPDQLEQTAKRVVNRLKQDLAGK
jgi:hypothetical protein